MKIKKIQQKFWGVFYYLFARHLPHYTMFYSLGLYKFRYYACEKMFRKCGKRIKVGQGALIGSGETIEMGSDSSIGKNCVVSHAHIGSDVMMGEHVIFYASNHKFDRHDIPMTHQGMSEPRTVKIEDDVWLGAFSIILPSCNNIGKGAIVAAGSIVTKDVPAYAIVGGNPAKLIKYRNE